MLFAHCVPRLTDQSTPEPEDAILNPPRIGLQTLSVIPTQKITRVWGNRAGISGLVGTLFLLSSYPKPPYPVSKRGCKGQKVQYLLSGLLKCQVCGNNFQMDFDKRQPKQSFYRCGSRHRRAKLCSNSRYLNRDRLETLILEMVSEVVLEKGHLENYYHQCLAEYNRNQGEREEELKRLRQQLQGIGATNRKRHRGVDAKPQFKGPVHSQDSIRRRED